MLFIGTGTTMMPLLCADIYTTRETVSKVISNNRTDFVLHPGAIPLSTALFGRGNATILVQNFGCTGKEQSLWECEPRNYTIPSYYSRGYNVPNRYVLVTFI